MAHYIAEAYKRSIDTTTPEMKKVFGDFPPQVDRYDFEDDFESDEKALKHFIGIVVKLDCGSVYNNVFYARMKEEDSEKCRTITGSEKEFAKVRPSVQGGLEFTTSESFGSI